MMLRASIDRTGGEAELEVITRESPEDGGTRHGALLLALVDAVTDPDADPSAARAALVEAAGPGLLVEAGAVLGMFHLNDRVADAMGVPLDELMLDVRLKVGERLGMKRSAA